MGVKQNPHRHRMHRAIPILQSCTSFVQLVHQSLLALRALRRPVRLRPHQSTGFAVTQRSPESNLPPTTRYGLLDALQQLPHVLEERDSYSQ